MKIVFILLIIVSIGCTPASETNKVTDSTSVEQTTMQEVASTYNILNVVDFKAKIEKFGEKEFHLVDVRTAGEVAGGTIENATNIDFYSSNFSNELAKLDKEKPLLIFCKSGGRSGKASQIAKKLGFVEIYDLKGGYMAWAAQ